MKQWSDSVICEYEATHHPLEAMPTSGGKTFCCFTFCKWDGVCLWPSSPKRKVVKTSKLLCLVNCQPQVELRTRFSWATKLSLKKRSRRHGSLKKKKQCRWFYVGYMMLFLTINLNKIPRTLLHQYSTPVWKFLLEAWPFKCIWNWLRSVKPIKPNKVFRTGSSQDPSLQNTSKSGFNQF